MLCRRGVPDPKKGERLVVLHTLAPAALTELLSRLPLLDLPNLWIPKGSSFFAVSELPVLGNGKLDLRKVHEIAARLVCEARHEHKEAA